MTQISAQQRFVSVRARLEELELWDENALVMCAPGVVFGAAGEPVTTELFSAVSAPMAVLTAGRYAREFVRKPHALRAETDDAAQMFGVRVPVRSVPRRGDAACIVPGTGFIVTARFENELIAACILLEKLSMTAQLSHRIGTPKPLGAPLCLMEHTVYTKKYSRPSLAAAQGEERAPEAQNVPDLALRESVIAYGRKLVENRLIQATWGNVSARIDENRFLITPSGVDYDRIRPEDIVEICISDGSFAAGQRPSSEREMHRRIYAARGDVRAVIHTHSAALQTFAACRESLHAPEIEAPCAAYGVSGSKKLAESASEVLRSHDLCIMANHGFTAVGADLATALSRAVSAEKAAKQILEVE